MFSCWQGSRANDRFLLLAREQTAVSGLLVHRVTRAKEKEREREETSTKGKTEGEKLEG